MPEGPEVHTIVNKLQCIVNSTLQSITFTDASYAETEAFYNQQVINYLPAKIEAIFCRGKYIFFMLVWSDKITYYLHSHLMMTGRWSWSEEKHTKLILNITDAGIEKVYFSSVRGLSKFTIIPNFEHLQAMLSKLGPDILQTTANFEQWWSIISRNGKGLRRNITSVLMDQSLFAGIGNYLKAEILYRSKIHPKHNLQELDSTQIAALYYYFYNVPHQAFNSGGLTIKDYWDPDGKQGTFARLIYGKEYDPYGNTVLQKRFSDGRNTYYVEEIQV